MRQRGLAGAALVADHTDDFRHFPTPPTERVRALIIP
jgi:hypothetical protein